MPRILKSNYENAIARHPEARKLRVKYPPPSRITLKGLVTITNKFGIGVGPSRIGSVNAKPLISQRKIQNQKNLNRFRLVKAKRAAEYKNAVAQKKNKAATQKKEMTERQKNINEINKLMKEIVKNIKNEDDLNYVMNNLFNGSPKKKRVVKKKAVKKGKGKGSKLFTARKKAAKRKAVIIPNRKINANTLALEKAIQAKRKAAQVKRKAVQVKKSPPKKKAVQIKKSPPKKKTKHPNYNNPNVILPGESWANTMNRINEIRR